MYSNWTTVRFAEVSTMKTYLLVAALFALAALFFFVIPSEEDRRRYRKPRPRETVHGVMDSGKRMGRSTGNAYRRVEIGRKR